MKLPDTEEGLIRVIAQAKKKLKQVRKDEIQKRMERGEEVFKQLEPEHWLLLKQEPPELLYRLPKGKTTGRASIETCTLSKGSVLQVRYVQRKSKPPKVWAIDSDEFMWCISLPSLHRFFSYPTEFEAQIAKSVV